MKKLSVKQYNMLMYIINHVFEKHYQPNFREIGENFGISYTAVYQTLKRCAAKEYIEFNEAQGRSIIFNEITIKIARGEVKIKEYVK